MGKSSSVPRRLQSVIAIMASCVAFACTPTLTPPEVPSAPAESHRTEQFYLLLYPEQDAQSLLGREVFGTEGGQFTVADQRALGCHVEARVEQARFKTRRQVAAEAVTTMAAGYAQLVSLQSKFGRSSAAELAIDNISVLRGRAAGNCGALIIDRVFVGTGSRRIVSLAEDAAEGGVRAGPVTALPKVRAAKQLVDELEWDDEQGYGFSFKKYTNEVPLQIEVLMPKTLIERDEVEVRFESARPAWLVVYALDESGTASVLWPSAEEPEPHVAPGAPALLPSARERAQGFKIRAATLAPGKPSRETLVVYAFGDVQNFRRLRPAPGSTRPDGAAFAAELTRELQALPVSQWSRSVTEYMIEPR